MPPYPSAGGGGAGGAGAGPSGGAAAPPRRRPAPAPAPTPAPAAAPVPAPAPAYHPAAHAGGAYGAGAGAGVGAGGGFGPPRGPRTFRCPDRPENNGKTTERYEVGRKIGQGSYGSVYLVRRRTDGVVFVVKELMLDGITEKEQTVVYGEAGLMERLKHPGVVGYHEWYVDEEAGTLCIVMQYCERGDLARLVKTQSQRKRTSQVVSVASCVHLSCYFC
jgi:hypothetical protein